MALKQEVKRQDDPLDSCEREEEVTNLSEMSEGQSSGFVTVTNFSSRLEQAQLHHLFENSTHKQSEEEKVPCSEP